MSIHLPTLKQLQYLVALRNHGHFGRAAEACFVTQSTLSAGIKELETLIGVTLVERTRRVVRFTPLGIRVAEKAQRILRETEDLADMVRAAGKPLAGELRMGVIPTIAPFLLPTLLPRLREQWPDLKLYLREETSQAACDALQRGQLDCVLLALPYACGDVDTAELFDDRLMVAFPPGAADGLPDVVPPSAIDEDKLLLLEDGHCLKDHALSACNRPELRAEASILGTSLHTLVQMVDNGLGMTLIPEMAVDGRHPGGHPRRRPPARRRASDPADRPGLAQGKPPREGVPPARGRAQGGCLIPAGPRPRIELLPPLGAVGQYLLAPERSAGADLGDDPGAGFSGRVGVAGGGPGEEGPAARHNAAVAMDQDDPGKRPETSCLVGNSLELGPGQRGMMVDAQFAHVAVRLEPADEARHRRLLELAEAGKLAAGIEIAGLDTDVDHQHADLRQQGDLDAHRTGFPCRAPIGPPPRHGFHLRRARKRAARRARAARRPDPRRSAHGSADRSLRGRVRSRRAAGHNRGSPSPSPQSMCFRPTRR